MFAKTMFVLEFRNSDSEGSINKSGRYQTGLAAVEAEVKDSRFPDGWAFFNFRDGTSAEPLDIKVRVNTEHYRFVPGRQQLVYIPTLSQVEPENFWILDLETKEKRRLAAFNSRSTRTFDITPDGSAITFDRLKNNSNLVLIDLPARQSNN